MSQRWYAAAALPVAPTAEPGLAAVSCPVSGTVSRAGGPRGALWPRRAGVRRESLYWLVCAGFALLLAVVTTLPAHRVWGVCATVGYAGAAVLACRAPYPWGRGSALAAVAGSTLLPLTALMILGMAQAEVGVVERSGSLLLGSGSPYVPHPVDVGDFNPYLPGMALFGLPHALLGDTPLADARLWFAAVFLAAMASAARARYATDVPDPRGSLGPAPRGNAALLLACFPAVALPLAVGGVDLPVIGLICLGLALAGRGGSGGAAMGAAAALKWTAWPLLAVGLALIAATAGRRAALRAAGTALLVAAVAVLPCVLVDPQAFVEHVVLFPLGASGTGSPATSPLPGYLLATYVPGGRAIAVGALAVSAVALAASLLVRPPRTVTAAADRLALGLGLAMCLMPATRFGYLVYPLVLVAWFRQERGARGAGPAESAEVPKETKGVGHAEVHGGRAGAGCGKPRCAYEPAPGTGRGGGCRSADRGALPRHRPGAAADHGAGADLGNSGAGRPVGDPHHELTATVHPSCTSHVTVPGRDDGAGHVTEVRVDFGDGNSAVLAGDRAAPAVAHEYRPAAGSPGCRHPDDTPLRGERCLTRH